MTFPFGFPWQTGFYLVLYVVTLILHVVFMNYVLAGSGYVAVAEVRRMFGRKQAGGGGGGEAEKEDHGPGRQSLATATLRDWLPFWLSAAITAGVAPLLFIQILYQNDFYTANLLLLHRWMAILPVLIVGFYFLYVLKTKRLADNPGVRATIVAITAFICFAFVGWSWTENHLLSMRSETWADFYGSDQIFFKDARLLPRLLMWAVGSIPTLALFLSWQLWFKGRTYSKIENAGYIVADVNRYGRFLAVLAIVGIVLTLLGGLWYRGTAGETVGPAISQPLARVYFVIACVGIVIQCIGWIVIAARKKLVGDAVVLWIVSVGLLCTVLGMTVVREAIRLVDVHSRLSEAEWAALLDLHKKATEVGGFAVFLIFAVINIGVVVWCARLVYKGRIQKPAD